LNTSGARIDVAVSTRAVEVNEVTRFNAIQNQQNVTLQNIVQVQTQNTDTQELIGNPSLGSVSADISEVMGVIAAILSKVDALPADPAIQSALSGAISNVQTAVNGLVSNLLAVKNKTDNLPADPASTTTVQQIPTTPLLAGDARLTNLDAPVSSRAVPANFSGIARASDVATAQSAIITELQDNVEAPLANLPTNADLSTALIPIAKEATSQSINVGVTNIITGLITPAQVWNYATRTLTAPVDITTDLSDIVRLPDLASAQASIIEELDFVESFMNLAVNKTTDVMSFQVWLNDNGQTVSDATSAALDIYNAQGGLIFSLGPASPDTPQGVFLLSRPNASTVLIPNNGYTAVITILRGSSTLRSIKSFTVV
jgi:hypothetical protein